MSTEQQQTHRREPRPDLRHDPARRRAVAGHLAEQAGKAGDRPPARAARRRRDRGRLPDHLARRLRVRAGDRARGRRPGDLRRSRARSKQDIEAAWNAVNDAERPRIHTFIATSDIHIERKLQTTREDVKGQVRAAVAQARELHRRRRVLARGRLALGRRVHGRGDPDRARRGRDARSTFPTPSATRCRASTPRCSTELYRLVPGLRERRRLGALPRRSRPGGRQLARRRWKQAAARSSARSTGSASAPATRRSRRS